MVYVGDAKREYQRQWLANRRAAFFKDKSCVICDSTDRLELDHIDRAQKVDHRIWSWSAARRAEEIAKCQVLCYTHHKAKTREESVVKEHGDVMYRKHGCKCAICTEDHAKKQAEWRAK